MSGSQATTTNETGLDPAVVCTLPEDGLAARLAWVREQILPHAVSSTRTGDGIAWELDDVPGLAAKLDELVALERECCSGLVFEHREDEASGRRRLAVRGIDPNAEVFAQLEAKPRRGIVARLGEAVGLGTAFGLVVCCVVPIVAASVLGAAVAAPFASLDQPGIIAGVAVVSGAAVFAWRGRPTRDAAGGSSVPCGPDC